MKHRVLFNTDTQYLAITASDVVADNLIELFSSEVSIENEMSVLLSVNTCNVFCLGYLQGNSRPHAKNSPKDFETKSQTEQILQEGVVKTN